MARLIPAALAAAGTVFAADVSIQYGTLPKSTIEERLDAVERSNPKREQVLVKLFGRSACAGEHLVEQPV
jgi:hypothetical protein